MSTPVDLDSHRDQEARKQTEARRQTAAVQADQALLRRDRDELEDLLYSGPSADWAELGRKVVYLLSVFSATYEGQDGRHAQLIQGVVDDIERLSARDEG